MGVPSLNDLAVDGTLNTTNQPWTNPRIPGLLHSRDSQPNACVPNREAVWNIFCDGLCCDPVGTRTYDLPYGRAQADKLIIKPSRWSFTEINCLEKGNLINML